MPKSFAPEVIADASGKWSGNGLRFATREEAERWVRDLERRWMLVIDTRVVESNDPVNYAIVDNQQVPPTRTCSDVRTGAAVGGVAGNLRCLVKVYRAVERYWRRMFSGLQVRLARND